MDTQVGAKSKEWRQEVMVTATERNEAYGYVRTYVHKSDSKDNLTHPSPHTQWQHTQYSHNTTYVVNLHTSYICMYTHKWIEKIPCRLISHSSPLSRHILYVRTQSLYNAGSSHLQ